LAASLGCADADRPLAETDLHDFLFRRLARTQSRLLVGDMVFPQSIAQSIAREDSRKEVKKVLEETWQETLSRDLLFVTRFHLFMFSEREVFT
jgi:uncharacterized membrane protein YheB (UPF0754 family)